MADLRGGTTIGGYIAFHYGNLENHLGSWSYNSSSPTGTTPLSYNGYLYATKVFNAAYNDLAEFMPVHVGKTKQDFTAGELLIWNAGAGGLTSCSKFNDNRVMGVYSDTYGQSLGGTGEEDNKVPIGISGRVWVKVKSKVKNGDSIVTSSDKGYGIPKKLFYKEGFKGFVSIIKDFFLRENTCKLKSMENFTPTKEEPEKRVMCLII